MEACREVTVTLPRTSLAAALSAAAVACALISFPAAAEPTPSPAEESDMAAGLAPLLAEVDDARAQRLAADKRYAAASAAAARAEAAVTSQKGAVAGARQLVGDYARAAYRSGPSELAFLAGLLDSGSPTDLMRRVDTAERVGEHKDTEYDKAQQVLARVERRAAEAGQARDRASEAVQVAATAEADALAEVTDYTGRWADQLAEGLGGATEQDRANSAAAQAWADWLGRPEARNAPTVTARMIRTGKDLPPGVTIRRSAPGVAYWDPDATKSGAKKKSSRGKRAAASDGAQVLLLPDQTVRMATYAVSRLGAGYEWRANTHEAMDCSALIDRGLAIPGASVADAEADRPAVPGGVPGLAASMKTVAPRPVLPGDVVYYFDEGHGVNHAGIAVTADTMIASAPLLGGVNAVPIDGDRIWRLGRPAAKPGKSDVPSAERGLWQCGSDPDELAQLSPGGWMFPTDDPDWRDERVNPGTEPGMRVHPVLGYARCHDGWDTGDGMGEPIYAVADGVAVTHPDNGGAGNMVSISHPGGVESVYMHLSAFAPGINGAVVKRGQLIGRVGSTGLSSGPHLHFQVNVDGQPVDPRHFFYNDPLTPACNG